MPAQIRDSWGNWTDIEEIVNPEGGLANPITEPLAVDTEGTPTDGASLFYLALRDPDQSGLYMEQKVAMTREMIAVQHENGTLLFLLRSGGTVWLQQAGEPTNFPGLLVDPSSLDSDPTADLVQFQNYFGVSVGGVTKNGYTYIADLPDGAGGPTEGAPDDTELVAGQCIIWFDKTNGSAKLMVKAKTANGTVVDGELALT